MVKENIRVEFYIHHSSGKFLLFEETFTTEESKSDEIILTRQKQIKSRYGKEISFKILEKVVLKTDDHSVYPEEETKVVNTKITRSLEMSAEDAINYIRDNSIEHLEDIDFIKDDIRITVGNAYKKKLNKNKGENDEDTTV